MSDTAGREQIRSLPLSPTNIAITSQYRRNWGLADAFDHGSVRTPQIDGASGIASKRIVKG